MPKTHSRSLPRALFAYSAIAALAATAATSVQADTTAGFAIDRFEPSARGSEWFAQDTLDFRGHARLAAGAIVDWGHKPLVIYNADGSERAPLVKDQLFAHLGASMVLWSRLRVGFNLPIAIMSNGDGGVVAGQHYPPANGGGVGDIRLDADVRLLGEYRSAFSLALGLQAWLPIGSRDGYLGDGKVRLAPRALFAGELGPFVYAGRVGLDYRALHDTFDGTPLGTTFTFGASAGVRLLNAKLVVGPEVWGSTVVQDGGAFTAHATPFEGILGAHYTVNDFRVGAGVGPGFTQGFGAPALRALLSLEWTPRVDDAPKDRDHDGVLDGDDACIDDPGVKTADAKTNGCPPDRDHDGILDRDDACIDVPGVKTSDPKTHGCPPDRDHDGIYDDVDACPDLKGVKSDDPKKHGCPPDRDGDGIYDADDACPDVPGLKNADPKENGCPGDRDGDGIRDDKDACPDDKGVADPDPKKNGCNPDRDGDGILNDVDACPDAPGPAHKDPKKNGCPAAAIVGGEIKILQQVKFATASDFILPESDKILTEIAKILRDHPEITLIRVEGHTDNHGTPKFNEGLSKRRAASVVKWLTTKGKIDAKRMTSEGYGQDKPIDTNDTEAGRQNNRRVEFHIVETTKPGAVKDK